MSRTVAQRVRARRFAAGVIAAMLVALAPVGVLKSNAAEPDPGASAGAEATEAPGTDPTNEPIDDPAQDATGDPTDEPTESGSPTPGTGDPGPQPPTDDTPDALGGVLGGDLAQAQLAAAQASAPAAALPAQAAEDSRYPGLPALQGFQWDGSATTSLTQVRPSRQFLRLPPIALAVDTNIRVVPSTPPATSTIGYILKAYVVSAPGSTDLYGDIPPFRTRLLAFGSLPVEATVTVQQVRDGDDLPTPLTGGYRTESFSASTPSYNANQDFNLAGLVTVQVSDLTLDGIAVDVGTSCRTTQPASLKLVGTGFNAIVGGVSWQLGTPRPSPSTIITPADRIENYYVLAEGGLLRGSLDVPDFEGCSGASGDLSAIVSNAVAGDDQPVSARQSGTFNCFPQEFVTECDVPAEFGYPTP